MKKNFIRRKGHLLYATMMIVLMLSGCGQIKPANYVHEAGEDLPMDAAAYAEFKSSAQEEMAMVDLSKVDPNKVGSYEAAIMLEDKKYPFTVEVMDTKAPEGTFQQFVVACGIDQTVTPEWFECSGTDASDFQYGIRSAELVKTEDELAKIIQENIRQAEAEGKEQLTLTELAGVTWNDEADTWDESDVSAVDLQLEFVPEENGLWQLEMLSVDEYGNANAFHVYVIADLEAPVFVQAEDVQVKMSNDFEKYMESLNEGLVVEDNYLGDITYQVEVANIENVTSGNSAAMKVNYKSMDLAGNEADATRNLVYTSALKAASNSQGVGSVYGPKLTQTELDEVAMAVQSFLANYITEGMTDYQKVRAANDFLCNTVSYADSWAYNGANTAWGALIYHEAQCSGFARAMKALCDGMGVGCYYIHSSTTSHQWNEVCVDGKWYIIDVTANATAGNGSAFLISDASFVNFWNGQGYSEDWNRSSVPACPNNY